MDLSQALSGLYTSLQKDLSWTPSIYLPSSHFTNSDNSLKLRVPDKTSSDRVNTEPINIIQLLSATDMLASMKGALQKIGYPPGCVFEIEGFSGVKDYKSVVKAIKAAALGGGTQLVVNHSKDNGSPR